MKSAVSVVIPLYNKAPYIERSVRSVLQQTFKDFEVIVVDDGSTDGGGDIVQQIADPRIRLIRQENAGVSAARNRGIIEAKAELVAFLDADDEWKPAFLETTLGLFQRYAHIVAACTDFYILTEKRSYFENHRFYSKNQEYLIQDYFAVCLTLGRGLMTSSSAVVRRDILLDVGAFPVGVAYGEDLDTWGRLAFQGDIALVTKTLVLFHTEAKDRASDDGKPRAYPKFVQTYKQWLAEGKVPEKLRESCEEYVIMFLLSYCLYLVKSDQFRLARKILREECSHTVRNRVEYLYVLWLSRLPGWSVPLLRWFKQSVLRIKVHRSFMNWQAKDSESVCRAVLACHPGYAEHS